MLLARDGRGSVTAIVSRMRACPLSCPVSFPAYAVVGNACTAPTNRNSCTMYLRRRALPVLQNAAVCLD